MSRAIGRLGRVETIPKLIDTKQRLEQRLAAVRGLPMEHGPRAGDLKSAIDVIRRCISDIRERFGVVDGMGGLSTVGGTEAGGLSKPLHPMNHPDNE